MDKVDIKMLFDKKQEEMLAKFNLSSLLGHPVSKGDATEAEWKNWFTSFFPDRYKAENAFVIDCKGNRSDQIDIVIYDNIFPLQYLNIMTKNIFRRKVFMGFLRLNKPYPKSIFSMHQIRSKA